VKKGSFRVLIKACAFFKTHARVFTALWAGLL